MSENMIVKEYLEQAFRLDQRINSKMEQITLLNCLATKATSTLNDVPPSGTRNVHRMEDIIVKIVDLESEINVDIDELVDLKGEIMRTIKAVKNTEYQTLLELRYLCFKTWEQIAVDMGYTVRNIHLLHKQALGFAAIKTFH